MFSLKINRISSVSATDGLLKRPLCTSVFYSRDTCAVGLTGQFCVLCVGVHVAIKQVLIHTNVMTGDQVRVRAGVRRHRSLVVHLGRIWFVQRGKEGQRWGPEGLSLGQRAGWREAPSRTGIAAEGQVEVLVQTKAAVVW